MLRTPPRALAATLAALLLAPAVLHAASVPECLDATAVARLSACPAGLGKKQPGSARRAPFHGAALAARAAKPVEIPKAPGSPDDLRDPRKATLVKKRIVELVVAETQQLERLLGRTPKKSPDRAQLLRRLAEGYVELEETALSDQTRLELIAEAKRKAKRAVEANKARSDAKRRGRIVAGAKKAAIGTYGKLASDYPSHPKLDEVLYFLALEHEKAGDRKSARTTYLRLLQQAPKSKYLPRAYLAFGELFFEEAPGDPTQWELAAQAYREVVKYPPPDNEVHAYARYKLAYVHWNRGEHAEALSQLKKVIDTLAQFPQLPGKAGLERSARRDFIPIYAASGRAEAAFTTLRSVSGDAAGGSEKTLAMADELGLAYLDVGRYDQAIVLYRDLLGRDPGERSCHYQTQITTAVSALHSGDEDAIKKELDRQLALRSDFVKADHPAATKLACSNATAELLAETAMSWHLEAVGSGGVRGTGDRHTKELAEQLYRAVLGAFGKDDFAQFRFPRILREDWPTRARLAYARADLLYEMAGWEQCASAFTQALEEDPKGPDAAESAYTAALCWQKVHDARHAGGADRRGLGAEATRGASATLVERLRPRPLGDTEQRMIEAFDRYLCVVERPKSAGPALDQWVEVKYAWARLYFEAQHWDEAAAAFRDVALEHPDSDAGGFAAQLYLEAANVLYAHGEPPRSACLQQMGADLPKLSQRYCDASPKDTSHCDSIARVDCDVGRLRAQALVASADSGKAADPTAAYLRAGDIYLGLWRTYGEAAISAGKPPRCQQMEEIPYDVAKAYQAGHALGKAIEARLILVDPKWGLAGTELGKRALLELGRNHQAIAVYDRAATFFERYVDAAGARGSDVDTALSDAVVLRLGLGQPDAALADAARFERLLGAKKPARAAQIAFAIAAHHAETGDFARASKVLGAAIGSVDRSAPFDVQVQAHALLGRSAQRLGKTSEAEREYQRVQKLWSDPKAAAARIDSGDDAATRERRLGRALTAVGEALFFFAEQKRARVDALRFPAYHGPGTKDAVLLHIRSKVEPWVRQKRPLIEEATDAYRKIVDLVPTAPPVWAIAAGARVGKMWGDFVEDFRAAPVPDSIKLDPELYQLYLNKMIEASEPQRQRAKQAFESCLEYSETYQHFDDEVRGCETWLAKQYPSEHHLIDELHGVPSRSNSALAERAPVLGRKGTPLR